MNILVTGATGRVGSRLVPRLLDQGYSVSVLVRNPEHTRDLQRLGAEIMIGDLLQPQTLQEAAAHKDAIVHLAAAFRGVAPEVSHAVNMDGTIALADAALAEGVPRFIYASTNLVYGPGTDERYFNEEDLPVPISPYPIAKAAAERELLNLYRSRGLGLCILRLAFVYGDGDPHLEEGVLKFRQWHPAQRIHLVHQADVAQAVMLGIESPRAKGQIFNVADDQPVSAAEILSMYNETMPDDAVSRTVDPSWLQLVDTAKIREQLEFRPNYPSLYRALNEGAL
ncbi:nucleoside-diphosphate-sugar epimerase [Paenibacillus rhizosphaerae]|uniref:Nucleoside-diphosphate-sugar epimerase n=1 Tax=Paenibacillus rhizosphaerae TaxID=297318 RepID=A0A839U1L5_9BACL|nr:NAD(P)-dependent oxidoreductase [Paenibacillus rhizosphaerae]MBB3131548.1 nucleoside-diphosphate-sugar epimerase [Paenibacillus rhizosphaerae]